MLSKLIKHEFKATARIILPLYLVLLVLTIVERVTISLKFKGPLEIIPGFSTMAYLFSIVAIIVISFVIIVNRFYKNLMTDEGYLMFTLPVSSQQIVNAKLLVSIVWTLISIIFVIASLIGAFMNKWLFDLLLDGFRMGYAEVKSELGAGNTYLLLIEGIVLAILSFINSVLLIYVSIAIGQLFKGHKLLGSFAAYIGIKTVLQIAATIALIILAVIYKKSFEDIQAIYKIILPFTIIYTIATNFLFYFGTDYIFKNKLNLE